MTPKKYQIFVSSTHADLSQIRRGLMEVIQRMNHFPVGMEQFSADDDEQGRTFNRLVLPKLPDGEEEQPVKRAAPAPSKGKPAPKRR